MIQEQTEYVIISINLNLRFNFSLSLPATGELFLSCLFLFSVFFVLRFAGNVGRHVRSHVRMLAHMQIDLHVRHIARASYCYFKVDRTCKKTFFTAIYHNNLKLFICSLKLEILLIIFAFIFSFTYFFKGNFPSV